MTNLRGRLQAFLVEEDGPTAVEYGILLALLVIVFVVSLRIMGTDARNVFASIWEAGASSPSPVPGADAEATKGFRRV